MMRPKVAKISFATGAADQVPHRREENPELQAEPLLKCAGSLCPARSPCQKLVACQEFPTFKLDEV